MENSAENTVIVPSVSDVPFDDHISVLVRQQGAGSTTITPASGVTIQNPHGTLNLSGQYAAVSLHYRGSDIWAIEGNLAES